MVEYVNTVVDGERQGIAVESLQVPDLWHIAQSLKDSRKKADQRAGQDILDTWHLSHDLLRHIRERSLRDQIENLIQEHGLQKVLSEMDSVCYHEAASVRGEDSYQGKLDTAEYKAWINAGLKCRQASNAEAVVMVSDAYSNCIGRDFYESE